MGLFEYNGNYQAIVSTRAISKFVTTIIYIKRKESYMNHQMYIM